MRSFSFSFVAELDSDSMNELDVEARCHTGTARETSGRCAIEKAEIRCAGVHDSRGTSAAVGPVCQAQLRQTYSLDAGGMPCILLVGNVPVPSLPSPPTTRPSLSIVNQHCE
jgi:hypothetical protein